MAKKCGSKWELGKMDRALIRMWQKVWVLMGTWQKCEGLNQNLDRALIRTLHRVLFCVTVWSSEWTRLPSSCTRGGKEEENVASINGFYEN